MSASQLKAILIHFPNLEDLTIYVSETSGKGSKDILEQINEYGANLTCIVLNHNHELKEEFVRENLKDCQDLLVEYNGHVIEI